MALAAALRDSHVPRLSPQGVRIAVTGLKAGAPTKEHCSGTNDSLLSAVEDALTPYISDLNAFLEMRRFVPDANQPRDDNLTRVRHPGDKCRVLSNYLFFNRRCNPPHHLPGHAGEQQTMPPPARTGDVRPEHGLVRREPAPVVRFCVSSGQVPYYY
jgi:hypothetical protein